MIAIRVLAPRCTGCGECVQGCPFDSVKLVDGIAVIQDSCGRCTVCVPLCAEGALEIVEAEPSAARPGHSGRLRLEPRRKASRPLRGQNRG